MDYVVVKSKTLLNHPMVRVVVDTLEYGGIQRPYYYLESPVDAVATVGLTDQGEIILTQQYRHPIRQVIYDLPAGSLHPDELPIDGARREFEEETGYFPHQIQKIGYFNQFPGSLRAGTTLFFASNLKSTRQNLDPGEFLQLVLMPVPQVLDMVISGQFIDGSLQLGVLLALQQGLLKG
jgi:ADP-ribose pyrophosphatase